MSVGSSTNTPPATGASGSSGSNGGSSGTSSKPTIGLTSNQFLSLLATQLQNQNPLNPTDPNQFTSEMVQYASLSEQIDTNTSLGTMNTSLGTMSSTMSDILTQVSLLASAGNKPAASES